MEVDVLAEVLKQKRIARMRFRGIVRAAIANKFWLSEIEEQIGFNYQRNVAIITRRSRKKSIITLSDKLLIKKRDPDRTPEERKRVVLLLANLNCFEKYSPKTRARLAPVIDYMYFGPERVVTREGNEAISMYYILDGEVTVSKRKWDYMKNKYVDTMISVLRSGDNFGEFGLIKNVKRPVTITTATHVELLVLYEHDFFRTVASEMVLELEQKKMVLSNIEYTKSWNFTQIYLACKLSTIEQYAALQTIYAEDKGLLNSVFFVISGQCMILQCLKLKVRVINGKKQYSLCKEEKKDTKSDIEAPTSTKLFELFQQEKEQKMKEEQERRLSDLRKEKEMEDIEEKAFKSDKKTDTEDHSQMYQVHDELYSEKLKETGQKDLRSLNFCGVQIDLMPMEAADIKSDSSYSITQKESSLTIQAGERNEENLRLSQAEKEFQNRKSLDESAEDEDKEPAEEASTSGNDIEIKHDSDANAKTDEKDAQKSNVHFAKRMDQREKSAKVEEEPDYIESHFVDVGTMSAGTIFGLGENMYHRAVMAKTTVYCLLLPRYWLFEKNQNPGNVWQRLQFHLNKTIPSREALFKDFLATQKWDMYKEKVVKLITDKNKVNNPTKMDDIPIICKIMEGKDE